MNHVPLSLNAGRCAVVFSLFFCMSAFAASSGTSVGAKARLRSLSAVFTVAEPPSFMLLALGMVGIGLHGIGRARGR